MAIQEWKKLVRDLIPQQLEAKNIKVVFWMIGDFLGRDKSSREKLVEEATEVLNAKTREELVGELADLEEIKETLMKLHQITPEEVEAAKADKKNKKGGFDKFYYLHSTTEPDPSGQ